MQCPRCRAENPAGLKLCGQCAARLAASCPSCGAVNPPGHKFCGQCATSLTGVAEPRFATPESYTPKHLAGKILTSKAALEAGRPPDAWASAERALQLSREREEPAHEARALRVLGDADAAFEPPDSKQVEASYRQALVLAETLGMRPLSAHCRLGLGTLYCHTGDRAKVEEHLTSATAMYREMGMTFWLDKTKATLNQSQPSGR